MPLQHAANLSLQSCPDICGHFRHPTVLEFQLDTLALFPKVSVFSHRSGNFPLVSASNTINAIESWTCLPPPDDRQPASIMPIRAGNCTITPPFVSLLTAMFLWIGFCLRKSPLIETRNTPSTCLRFQSMLPCPNLQHQCHAHINSATVSLSAAI